MGPSLTGATARIIKRAATFTLPQLMTAKEYGQLDEVLGFRDELIQGERVLSPNTIFPNAAVIEHLQRILKNQITEFSVEPLRVVRETGWNFHNPAERADSDLVPI